MGERVKIRAVPNAPKTVCAGAYGDAIKIKVAAVPEDGRANAELIKYVSKLLGVARNDVAIVGGETSRDKVLEIEGISDCTQKILDAAKK